MFSLVHRYTDIQIVKWVLIQVPTEVWKERSIEKLMLTIKRKTEVDMEVAASKFSH